MTTKLKHALWIAATVALAWQPTTSQASFCTSSFVGTSSSVTCGPTQPDVYVGIDDGTYGDPQSFGGFFTINPNGGGSIDNLDVTFSGAINATFNSSDDAPLSQGTASGDKYDYDIVDTTDTYQLDMVLDDWSNLVAGQDGATFDPASEVVFVADTSDVVGNQFSGQLEVPAPAALPVFATALGMLGVFRRRRGRGPTAA